MGVKKSCTYLPYEIREERHNKIIKCKVSFAHKICKSFFLLSPKSNDPSLIYSLNPLSPKHAIRRIAEFFQISLWFLANRLEEFWFFLSKIHFCV